MTLDDALARLAQELDVPAHLLNLPKGNSHFGQLDPFQDWREAVWQHLESVPRLGWTELYEGPPGEPQ